MAAPGNIPFPVQHLAAFDRRRPGTVQERLQAAEALFSTAREHGFLYVRYDPFIEQRDVDAMFDVGKDFFAMPRDDKMRWKIPGDYYTYKPADEKISYKGIGATANDLPAGVQAEDNKEVYNLPKWSAEWHRTSGAKLPPSMERNRALVERFQRSCHNVVVAILDALSIGLRVPDSPSGPGETYLSRTAHNWPEPAWTFTRWLHYPPLPPGADTTDAMQRTGQFRNPGHTDVGLMTLLFQQDVGGLQYRAPDGKWTDVPIVDGCMVVNVADTMQVWTAGLLPSVFHRVVSPPSLHAAQERRSMTYFAYGDNRTPLRPIPSPLLTQSWPEVYRLHGLDVVMRENATMGEFTARRSGQNRPGLVGAGTGGGEGVAARM
ncbi:hypothetical protein DFJ74DRAFT_629874 [Hyaloraphidium curvatum]|nr:hypothetical protein DFJ74DRAFT_629874 [Hyaloraphidium curvatum]